MLELSYLEDIDSLEAEEFRAMLIQTDTMDGVCRIVWVHTKVIL